MDKWTRVNGYKELPVGNWLVLLNKEVFGSKIQVAAVHPNMVTVSGHFAFDVPMVIGYMALPSETEFAD